MEIKNTALIELRASEGMILVGPDGYGAKLLYLGIYDSPNNYKEIPEADYVEPEEPGEPGNEHETLDMIQRIIDEEANKDE